MSKQFLAIFLIVASATSSVEASITVARIGGIGQLAANTVFSSGDLAGSIVDLTSGAFNAQSPGSLAANYDVLLFGWTSGTGNAASNLDWNSRILPYLNAGGGVVFEQPSNLSDLAPGVLGVAANSGSTIVSASVPGLTDGITDNFTSSHITFTSWTAELNPFLTNGSGVVGLYGEFGSNGGRIVLTGPDPDYHAFRGAGGIAGNEYNMLLNKLSWVSSGVPVSSVVPEPTAVIVWSLLAATGLCGWRRKSRA